MSDSSTVTRLVQSAREMWLRDDFEESLSLFREAVSMAPHDQRLAVEFASYLGLRLETEEAMALLQRSELALADNVDGLYHVALAYDRAFAPEQTLRCLQQIVTANAAHSASWIKMAEWYDRRGMLEEASRSLAQVPVATPEVQLWKAKLKRRHGDFAAASEVLEPLITQDGITEQLLISVWYELAAICDARGDYELAFSAAESAKRLQQAAAVPQLKAAQRLAKLEANFVTTVTSDCYRDWAAGTPHAKVALLTGSPRSGTTLMARALGNHASVLMADEINAYATYAHKEMLSGMQGTSAAQVLNGIGSQRITECQTRYLKWMNAASGRRADGDTVLLDKNPSTTFLIPAFRRLFPQAAIMMAIRDPRDVIVSCFLQQFPLNPVSALFTRLEFTVMRCRAELEAWLRLRDKLTPPWCEIRYERLVSGDERELSNAVSELGLAPQEHLLDFRGSLQSNAVRSPTYAQLFKPVHTQSIGRWRNYEAKLQPYLSQLQPVLNQLGYT